MIRSLLYSLKTLFLGSFADVATPEARGSRVIHWGTTALHDSECTNHFLAMGTTGSGKTSLFRLLEQTVFPNIGSDDYRAVVYDAKGETIPRIASQVDSELIYIMNPFDLRGVAWDIARDLDEPIKIKEFCFTLMPVRSDSQPFWAEAARDLMNGVMLSLFLSKVDYTLGDVLRVLRHFGLLQKVLQMHPQTSHLVGIYLRDKRLRRNLMATIGSRVQIYEPVASCWEHATKRLSIKEFVKGRGVLILGNAKVSPQVIQAINCAMFKSLSNECLNLPDSTRRRTWFFLDELTEAGRLDGLVSLAKEGRSKGVCLVLGFQTVSGMRDDKLYGVHGTDDLLGEIGIRFIGRLECATTAEYASQHIGDHLVWEQSFGRSKTYSKENSTSTSVNSAKQQRRRILPSEFMGLPKCNIGNGLHGFCQVPSIGVFRMKIAGERLFYDLLKPPCGTTLAFEPRPASSQLLDYSAEIVADRLNIDLTPKRKRGIETNRPSNHSIVGTPFDPLADPTHTSNTLEPASNNGEDSWEFNPDPLGS